MAGSPRAEIPNGYIPLTFLLGRRASEYNLPSLTHPASRKPPPAGSVLSERAHVRQREQQARVLLQRVLAREVRVDVNGKADHDTALAPPQVRVSTADRRRRAAELQRVLEERGEDSSVSERVRDPSEANTGTIQDLYEQRERFAQYHGYVPPERDFVEVVGHHERIQRTQSLRQLHDEDKRKRVKQLKAKQSRVETLRHQLKQQQAETKQNLKHAESRLRGPALDEENEEEEANAKEAEEGKAMPDRSQQKTIPHTLASKRGQQRATEDSARLAGKAELKERHESVQRSRQERQSQRNLRRATHEYDKTLMAKLAGPGPSFQSTLRVEDPEPTGHTSSCPALPFDGLLDQRSDADDELAYRNEFAARLQERQLDVFERSRTRSLQFGGGFGSKPRVNQTEETIRLNACEEHEGIATHATSVGVVKSKREMLAEWKTTLSAQGHRSR